LEGAHAEESLVLIDVFVREVNKAWFGLAYNGCRLVATAMSSDKAQALRSLVGCIPSDAQYRIVENGSEFAEKAVVKLEAAHRGVEEFGTFELATEWVPEPLASVLIVAASIPAGYVSSYGSIAKAAHTEPQEVGRIMASNPLYPLVACHRVVGADFSLVGYSGRKSLSALKAKLTRLNAECRGFTETKDILTNRSVLRVYPTERVIQKAMKQGLNMHAATQLKLTSYE
jgi:O6-methylguanine-DNA--protein-cysteine methyltransferase